MLLTNFYMLQKTYGTTIQYVKVLKLDVNTTTGQRPNGDVTYNIPALFTPVTLVTDFIVKLAGRLVRVDTVFMVRKQDLPVTIMNSDYVIHRGIKYKNLQYEDLEVIHVLAGETTQ